MHHNLVIPKTCKRSSLSAASRSLTLLVSYSTKRVQQRDQSTSKGYHIAAQHGQSQGYRRSDHRRWPSCSVFTLDSPPHIALFFLVEETFARTDRATLQKIYEPPELSNMLEFLTMSILNTVNSGSTHTCQRCYRLCTPLKRVSLYVPVRARAHTHQHACRG